MKLIPMFVLAGLVYLASFATSAQGQIVFGNGNLSDTSVSDKLTFEYKTLRATPFYTHATSDPKLRTLAGAWVLVGGANQSLTFTASIYSYLGQPSANLGSGSLTIVANTNPAWYYVPFSSPIQLSDFTNYYLVLGQADGITGQPFNWYMPNNNTYSTFGSGSDFNNTNNKLIMWYNPSQNWQNDNKYPNEQPLGYQLQAVPEPGSMILTGLALAGMGGAAWRRRRNNKTPAAPTDAATMV